ncbi:MAG: ThiF family adenylyltransferase [Pseudomonadota bacterium]
MTRYGRQMLLPDIGQDGQSRLARARILVVGAGGLAAPALPLLAGSGVGQLTILDPDVIELTNLHRQTMFSEADCGHSKAQRAAETVRAINSSITVIAEKTALTGQNAKELVAGADLVLDCADSYAASYLLSDTCLDTQTALISASVLGFGGYAGGFCAGAPSIRAVFPDAPDNSASCATAGVIGPAVTMIGAIQAQMALSCLLRLEPSPLGQMVQLDARSWRFSSFRFDTAPEPERGYRFVAASQLTEQDLIVELRDAVEAPIPVHPAAERMSPEDLPSHLPVADGRLALCCATGLRAWRTAELVSEKWPGEIVLVSARTS